MGAPLLERISFETPSKVAAALPFTATTRSPASRPAAAAGVFAETWPTLVVGVCDGAPVMKTTKKMMKATRMFMPGPAAMIAMRLQVAWRQYASRPVPSSSSRIARFADRRAEVESCARSSSLRSSGTRALAAAKSSASSARRAFCTNGSSAGSSRTALCMNVSTSRPEGRFMPGMRTIPPSGIAPMPYSMPLRCTLKTAGGNPT